MFSFFLFPARASTSSPFLVQLLFDKVSCSANSQKRFLIHSSLCVYESIITDVLRVRILFFFLQLYCPNGISPMGNSGCFPRGKPAATGSCYQTYTVHAGCFSVSIIHRTLTWTTGSFTCAQMLMHAIAHGGVRTHVI